MTNEQQPETAAAIRDDTRTMLIATAEGLAEATKRNAALQAEINQENLRHPFLERAEMKAEIERLSNALEMIAKSNATDMTTMHPEGCPIFARAVLNSTERKQQ
jgi:hypothetical protein